MANDTRERILGAALTSFAELVSMTMHMVDFTIHDPIVIKTRKLHRRNLE